MTFCRPLLPHFCDTQCSVGATVFKKRLTTSFTILFLSQSEFCSSTLHWKLESCGVVLVISCRFSETSDAEHSSLRIQWRIATG